MSQKNLTREDFRTDLEAARTKLSLIEQLEKLCPGYSVVLTEITNGKPKTTKSSSSPPTTPPAGNGQSLSIRDKVSAATRGKWVTLEQIIAATGLDKDQIYGVIAGKASKDLFDRKLAPGEPEHGKKQYCLKEKK